MATVIRKVGHLTVSIGTPIGLEDGESKEMGRLRDTTRIEIARRP